ncbi:MAG: MarR family winged helix-turn-helix transcriptional regulator [Acidimicrobiales bacterium]
MRGEGDERPIDACSGVFLLARELRRHISDLMAEDQWATSAGFRPPCMGALAVIAARQPVSQREISDRLGVDASDMVGVVDVLESAGLVERRRDPEDRRRHAVVLTAQGESAARHFEVLRAEAEARALSALDPEERRLLADLLGRALGRDPLAAADGR